MEKTNLKPVFWVLTLIFLSLVFVSGCSMSQFAYYKRGNLHYQQKEYDQSIENYSTEIRKLPSAKAYTNRGAAYHQKGLYDQAIEDYNRAIEIRPEDAKAYNNRGAAYHQKGQYDQAIEDYSRAIEINPNYSAAYMNRGSIYDLKGLVSEAFQDFRTAFVLKSRKGSAQAESRNASNSEPLADETEAHHNQGIAAYYNRAYDQSIDHYSIRIGRIPDAKTYTNRGAAYFQKGLYDRAIEDYEHAIRLNPGDAKAYNNLGAACFQQGLYDMAIENYTRAVEIDPNYAIPYANRGLAFAHNGLNDRAYQDVRIACILESFGFSALFAGSFDNKPQEIKVLASDPVNEKRSLENSSAAKPESTIENSQNQTKADNPDKEKEEAASAVSASDGKGTRYTLHVASFRNFQFAKKASDAFKNKGGKDVFIKKVNIPRKGGKWYRVYIGKYKDEEEALYFGHKLKYTGVIDDFSLRRS